MLISTTDEAVYVGASRTLGESVKTQRTPAEKNLV